MGFSRHEYWSGFPRPPPGDLPDPGTEPTSLPSPALTTSTTWEAAVSVVTEIGGHPQNSKIAPIEYL